MMNRQYRKPVAFGLIGGLGLIALYLALVRIGSASWPHTVELLLTDWYFVTAVATGFSIQIGLFTHLRQLIRQKGGMRSATAMAAGGTATSTTSMVACCLHHLTEVLPVIGLSGAAVFFTTYKVPVILFGLAANGLGIGMMLGTIRRHAKPALVAAGTSTDGGRSTSVNLPAHCEQGGSTVTPAIAGGSGSVSETLVETTLPVIGMSCTSCAATVEGAVKSVRGVRNVNVNLAAGKALVTYDPARAGLGDFARAVRDVGYEVGGETLRLQVSGMTIRDLGYEAAERLEGAAAVDRERDARQQEIVRQGRWMLVAWPLALVVKLGTPGHTDRLLVALVVVAGATFVAVALWLVLGLR